MIELYTKVEVDALFESLHRRLTTQEQEIQVLKSGQSDWVNMEEAMRLTGRSRGWFYNQRDKAALPIAMLPRTEGNRRTMYSRADCVAYGRKRAILPPVHLAPII